MAWNCVLHCVMDCSLDELLADGWRLAGPMVQAEEAVTGGYDGLAARQVGPHVVLLSTTFLEPDLSEELADGGYEVVTAAFSGVSDIYQWSVDGPDTDRNLVVAEGEVIQDEGEPTPEEAALASLDALDEDALFDLFQDRTGIGLEDWIDEEAQPIRHTGGTRALPTDDESDPDSAAAPRPGLLSRIFGRA